MIFSENRYPLFRIMLQNANQSQAFYEQSMASFGLKIRLPTNLGGAF